MATGAVPLLRLGLLSQRYWCWIRRRGGSMWPPAYPIPKEFLENRRGGYQPPESLPPSRGKVPPKGADEGALLERRLLSLPVVPLLLKSPLSKGGAAKRRGNSPSQRTFTAHLFFLFVGAHTVRPRAGQCPAPTKRRDRFRVRRRGGTPGRPKTELQQIRRDSRQPSRLYLTPRKTPTNW